MSEPNRSRRGTIACAIAGLLAVTACKSDREPDRDAPSAAAPVCALARTRAGAEIVPAEAASNLRAFVHPPPTRDHAERMVLIAAAFAIEDTGRLPSWNPADILASFRVANRQALGGEDTRQSVTKADALIAAHLIPDQACEAR